MPIDPSILLKFQSTPQIESPVNALTKGMQLRAMQDESDLNALRRTEIQRNFDQEAQLAEAFSQPDFDITSRQSQAKLGKIAPSKLPAYLKLAAEMRKDDRLAKKAELEGASEAIKISREMFAGANTQDRWTSSIDWLKERFPELANQIPPMWSPVNQENIIRSANGLEKQIQDRLSGFNLGENQIRYQPNANGTLTQVARGPNRVNELMDEIAKETDPQRRKVLESNLAKLTQTPPTYFVNNQGDVFALTQPTTPGGPPTVTSAGKVGRPSPAQEKVEIEATNTVDSINSVLPRLKDIIKPGGLIDQSTGSGLGALADRAAGFIGGSTKGAQAIASLAPIADLVKKLVPRFEGPQSDKDTADYEKASGQLADPTIPRETRKAAARTIIDIMTRRRDQFDLKINKPAAPAATPDTTPAATSGATVIRPSGGGGQWRVYE